MKPQASGEILALAQIKKFKSKLYIKSFGKNKFVSSVSKDDLREAKKALRETRKIFREDYNLIILDEINVAVAFGLIDIKQVTKIIESRPIGMNVVLTGRRAHLKMLELADLVTEMRKIKHPFDKGIKAKMGMEY
jgi:cob(I)alamin adenosyltransferase